MNVKVFQKVKITIYNWKIISKNKIATPLNPKVNLYEYKKKCAYFLNTKNSDCFC